MGEDARWWNRQPIRLALLGLATGLFALFAWLGPRLQLPAPSLPVSRTFQPAPIAVAPQVYLLGRLSPAGAYVIQTSDGLVLIDSGLEARAPAVLAQLAELRLDVTQLRAILLTHAHGDHTLGAAHLRSLTGAKVHAGRADCEVLRQGKAREAFFSTFHFPHVELHPTQVDVELQGDEILEFGDTRIEVLATPGHTPGSVCYLLERKRLKALFTGDVIQSLNPASGGALGTYAAHLPPLYRGNARDYLRSLRKLRALPTPDLILPGHPRMDPVPQATRLDEDRWHALLDSGITEMEKLLARFAADGADFLDGTARELLPGLHYLGNVNQQAVYVLQNESGLYLFDAPDAKVVDLLARRARQLGWKRSSPTAVLLTSADPRTIAGLGAVIARSGCKVVALQSAAPAIRKACPPGTEVLNEEDLVKRGWFEVRTIPLGGRGISPLAYVVRHAGKVVLLSGRMPVKSSVPAFEELTGDLGSASQQADYVQALDRLARITPDLWLPALPVHGQNANLYDREWANILQQNRQIGSW